MVYLFVGADDFVALEGQTGGSLEHALHRLPVLGLEGVTQIDQQLTLRMQTMSASHSEHVAEQSGTFGQSLLAGRCAHAKGCGLLDGGLEMRRGDGGVIPFLGLATLIVMQKY
jgi:hypothetical protein